MTIILYCGHPIVLEGKKTCIHHVYFQIINVLKMIPYVVLTTRFRAAAKVCIGQNFILVFFSFFLFVIQFQCSFLCKKIIRAIHFFLLSISKFRILAYLEGLMVFNATFNNFSVISWWSVVLVEETGVNHRPVASY